MAYEINEAKRLVIEAGHRLVEAGLIARTWGNISARISDTEFVITPSGKGYDVLTPDDIVAVKIEDCSYEGDIKPSSEKGAHAAAYAHRKDVDFIIHTHQFMATAYGTLGEALKGVEGTNKELLGASIPCGEYAISSTKKLAKKMEDVFAANLDCNSFFMRNHGVICLGKSFDDAFLISTATEELCEVKIAEKLGDVSKYKAGEKLFDVSLSDDFKSAVGCAKFVSTPAIVEVSNKVDTLKPMIDDMAQIAGTKVTVISDEGDWEQKAVKALKSSSAVLIKGKGAICVAKSEDDCDAIGIVLDKNCFSKLYAMSCGADHKLGYLDALLQRTVYLKKYSKLK